METINVTHLDAALAWLSSNEARIIADRLVRRYGLPLDAGDLLSEAVVKVHEAMSRRVTPLVGDDVELVAIKYANRALGNVAIDRARRKVRDQKQEIELIYSLPQVSGPESQAEAVVFVEQLISGVNRLVREAPSCPGCQREVVFAATTEVLQLVLIEGMSGDNSTRDNEWFDDIIVQVIDRTQPSASQLPAARRKRRARCKKCVLELLGTALQNIGYHRG